MGPTAIARELTAKQITNRLGKPFAKTQIIRILGRQDMEKAA